MQPFLTWLFSDPAVNCKPLKLSPAAAAIRYLMNLAWFGVPTEILAQGPEAIHAFRFGPKDEPMRQSREALKEIAWLLWSDLLQSGKFNASSKEEAQRFLDENQTLRRHASFERARKFLDECEVPSGYPPESATRPFAATDFFQERGNSYLDDDLSERIAAADGALEQSGTKGRHALIAQALNASPRTADRLPKNVSWSAVEVRERVKTYKRQKNSNSLVQLANN